MADITISLTIPQTHTRLVLDAVEHYLRARGEIDPKVTFTPVMAKAAIKQQCQDRIRELVLVYRHDILQQDVRAQAQIEMEALELK